jgi:hypothetical protein
MTDLPAIILLLIGYVTGMVTMYAISKWSD